MPLSVGIVGLVFAGAALVSTARSTGAQSQTPRIALGAGIGLENFAGGEFVSNEGYVKTLSASIRLLESHRFGVQALASWMSAGSIDGERLICEVTATGGCRPGNLNATGWTFGLGVERHLLSHLSLRASAGTGWLQVTEGPIRGTRAYPLGLDMIVPFGLYFALVASGQRTFMPSYGDDQIQMKTFALGMRLQ